jgi:tripeptidyl-peptidase-1
MAKLTALRLVSLLSLVGVRASAAVVLEQLAQVPSGWSEVDTPSQSSQLVLQVALAQQNIDQLESRLAAVSMPNFTTYGKYLDLDDVNAIFGPSKASSAAVESWLQSYGVTDYSSSVGGSIWFQTNVSTANAMLSTDFKTYSDSTGAAKLRTLQYSIPESLVPHVDFVSPTTFFGTTIAMRARKARNTVPAANLATRQEPASCKGSLVFQNETFVVFKPDCIRTEYNVNGYTPIASSGSRIGYGSFLNQSSGFSDLALFEQHFNIPSQNFSVILINNGTDLPQPPPLADDGEANLDVQNIVSIVHPLPITEFITAGSPPYFPFLLSKTNAELPQVISNSYGDEEQTVPQSYAVRVCNLIGLMGLRGISILESSGDEGVGASCVATNSTTPQFNPIFPVCIPSHNPLIRAECF